MSSNLRKNYYLVNAAYWVFTLTDGALRMLVLLHFYSIGYDAFQLASLFLFYELAGVPTNLVGGLGCHTVWSKIYISDRLNVAGYCVVGIS